MKMTSQRYISSELTHFVGRGLEEDQQYEIMLEILRTGFLSHPPHDRRIIGNLSVNTGAKLSQNEMYSPQVVCFCDIPLQDLQIHFDKYSPFGLSFEKEFVVKNGGAPVFYIPAGAKVDSAWQFPPDLIEGVSSSNDFQEAVKDFSKGEYFDWMITTYHKLFESLGDQIMEQRDTPGVPKEFTKFMELRRFLDFHIFGQMKFFDHLLSDDHPDNFYFEREWRIIGNLTFSIGDVVRVILPRQYASHLRNDIPQYHGQITYSYPREKAI